MFIIINISTADALTIDKAMTKTGNSLTSGLIGYWTFDGKDLINNVADLSGQGHTGYMSNFTSTSSAVAPGEIGQALGFDGVNDLVDTGASDWINTSALTVSAWIKPRSHGEGGAGSILDNRKAIFGMYDGAGTNAVTFSSNAGVTTAKSANGSVPFNKWTHVIATRDASGVVNFYVNGILSGTANQSSGTPASGTVGVQIGNTVFLSRTWDGYIDDLRVYNRVLSATEARQLYNQNSSYVSKTNTQINGASVGLGAGLVGHWTFDGKNMVSNVADSSGQGNSGLMSGFTSTSSAVTAGRVGQGLSFDGSNDYVDAGSNSSLDSLPVLSLSFWMKPSGSGSGSPIAKDQNSPYDWYTIYDSSTQSLLFRVTYSNSSLDRTSSTNSFPLNQWAHVVVTWNGQTSSDPNAIRIFKNGQEISYVSNTGGGVGSRIGDGATKLFIGSRCPACGTPYNFSGSLDDVRVYNRVISDSEIKQLYSQGSAKVASTISRPAQTGLSLGLVGHWTFDGKNMVSNVADSSGQGNNGLMSGFTSTSSAVTAGKVGQGLRFDGVDDMISVTNDVIGTSPITIAAWIYPRSAGELSLGAILDNVQVRFYTDSNRRFRFTSNGNVNSYSGASNAVTYNKWQFAVVTRDASGIANIYINGVLTGTADQNSGTPAAGSTIRIGNRAAGDLTFDGSIDDIRIYNRVLSTSEVQQLYNMGK
jgi:hypothetical protein